MVIDELKKSNIINCTEEGKILIIPLSRYEYQTNPLNGEFIEITEDEYIGLKMRVYQFSEDLKNVETFNPQDFIQFLKNKNVRLDIVKEG